MTVLFDTAEKISKILHEYAEAAVKLNHEVWEEFKKAVEKAVQEILEGFDDVDLKDGVGMKDVKGLVKGLAHGLGKGVETLAEFDVQLVLKLDTAALNRIVTTYQTTLHGLTARFDALKDPLDEAYLSAPKFEAGVARAHGFGGRALDEFKDPQRWITEDKQTGKYTLDLASNEWLENGHTLDKHVGKTDDQLVQRLRDQQDNPGSTTSAWPHGKPGIRGSSAFPNYERAQELTQYNLNNKAAEIKAWLTGPPPPDPGQTKLLDSKAPNGEVSGRSVSKTADPGVPGTGYKDHGMNAKVVDVTYIETRIKYTPGRDPAFTVLTSMPAPAP